VSKYVDKASPGLFQDCCVGKHHDKATLEVRKAGGAEPVVYLKYEMDEVFISSISTGGSGGSELASESITLNFAKMKVTYTAQNADGTAGTSIPKWYHVKEHKFG
jgi:type VI secretion system secreted protein Hcp